MNQIEMEHLKRVTDICTNRGRIIERHAATNDRQALMIYAKDRQISELTRMLFALGKQDGQTIRTQAAEIAATKELIQETLDLLRTGCAPDAFNMDEKQWMNHKINRAASFLSALLRGKK